MIAEKWTINHLATELAVDRRVLARRLGGLAPAEQRTSANGKRTERFYMLADVFAHLVNPEDDGLDLNAERAKLTRLQQEKLNLELGAMRGDLIRRVAVAEHWTGMVARMRAKLLALPSKIAGAIASPDKLHAAQDAAQALVYEALTEIARGGVPDDERTRTESRKAASRKVKSKVSGMATGNKQ